MGKQPVGVIYTSKSGHFRIIQHETGYSIQKHMDKGWRDCLDCQYCETVNQAISEMNRKELELFIEKGW